ncbi:MAG: substrate-binding domain-containing protein, partial [Gammaproteobacteria bacterium]
MMFTLIHTPLRALTLLALVFSLAACDSFTDAPYSPEKAADKLNDVVKRIDWNTNLVKRRANISLTKTNLMDSLPPIDNYPIKAGPTGNQPNSATIEIFSSSEKSGDGPDGWLTEVVTAFNRANIKLDDGRTAQVALRKIASGTAYQFIASGRYKPQAFTPSNALWGEMVKAHGVKLTIERERLVGNTAGIVMKQEVAERLKAEYPSLSVENLIDAVVQGKLIMGYTNPYASSTGLNFLVTVLNAFSGSADEGMLEPAVVSALQRFQQGVPFVAMTTLQMRESVSGNGTLDAFVMEYQTFAKTTPPMANEYVFIPFGYRHDNPLYSVGDLEPTQRQVLDRFLSFIDKPEYTALADRFGFNADKNYRSAYPL